MEQEYARIISEAVNQVYEVMAQRVTPEEMALIRKAYEFARDAHKSQRRKSGEPYIIHPITVALIAAEELKLDASTVMASFLHDVVEDTHYTIEDIQERFGSDVAFLVGVVTKKKHSVGHTSKQVENYRQLLDSVHYDIRALMVKIADRLHNMRTLASMRPDKQMKIAGETDYFYAPLANRLGLYDVKTDLENLSFKYRCPHEYHEIYDALERDSIDNFVRLANFTKNVEQMLRANGIECVAEVYYRKPYSIWRKMKSGNKDFKHIDNKYYVRITFTSCSVPISEKETCVKIYSHLTDVYKEKPGSFNNLIDAAKENSYQSLNVMLLSEEGVWEDVQICSHRMVESSKLGCLAQRNESIAEWIDRFRLILNDLANSSEETGFIENVVTSLYYDDVMVFTPDGRAIILPKGATAIDFAFEVHSNVGLHAKYARINGKLCSVKTELQRGDCVEIGTDDNMSPKPDWIQFAQTYKAKRALRGMFAEVVSQSIYQRCEVCHPLPGGETIGFKLPNGKIMIHRKNCHDAIHIASKSGDSIVDIDYMAEAGVTFPVTISIKAIDRFHLLMDLIDNITNKQHLLIDSLTTTTKDEIVDCTITFFVHSVHEMRQAISHLYGIEGVDEVRRVSNK